VHADQTSGPEKDLVVPPSRVRLAASTHHDVRSPAFIDRLHAGLNDLQRLRLEVLTPLLNEAVAAIVANDPALGAALAVEGLKVDDQCGVAWHILAVCHECSDDFTNALKCYDLAFKLNPDEPELAHDLGRLAYRMGFLTQAEQLYRLYLATTPTSLAGINDLANTLRDQFRFAEAVETIRSGIQADSGSALLWNTLGTIMAEQGEMEKALVFCNEALRLDEAFDKARWNRANVLLALGETKGALEDCTAALAGLRLDSDLAMTRFGRATMLLANGDLGEGWDAYEARLDPHYAFVSLFAAKAPLWTPDMDLWGKRLLLVGEQGVGDEILFANIVADLVDAVGPDGRLILAAEPRLVELFRRSFPQVEVGPHGTGKVDHHVVRTVPFVSDWSNIDAYAPMASPLRRFRRRLEDFPKRSRHLTPDPQRVAHWRRVLSDAGLARPTGIVWKSLLKATSRARYYAPFADWAPVLSTPGVSFVNLQYGSYDEELDYARHVLGVDIWTPPDVDLKNDFEDLAAIAAALDLVIGPANAMTNLAAAVGAPTWLISTPGAWPRLGTDHYPWYVQMRVFTPPTYTAWSVVMEEVADALRAREGACGD